MEKPAYYVVIFTNLRNEGDKGYAAMAKAMQEAVEKQEGYLGMMYGENAQGYRFTLSYWNSLEAIQKWKALASHQKAQKKGKEEWYQWYKIEVCEVLRAYGFGNNIQTE